MPFTSVEEIQEHYRQAIAAAGEGKPGAIVELANERNTAIAEFRLRQAAERERAIWVREAIHEYPLARLLPELLNGETEEDIRASAQRLHQKLESGYQDHQKTQEMERVYADYLANKQKPPQEKGSEPAAV